MHKLPASQNSAVDAKKGESLNDEQFEELILEDIPASQVLDASLQLNRARFYLETLSHFLPPGRMLDTQAQNGLRMLEFTNHGWQAEGLEADTNWQSTAPQHPGLQIHNTSICEFDTHRCYDLVIANNIVCDESACDEMAGKLTSLVTSNGYLLLEHNQPVIRGQKEHQLNKNELLNETDKLLNQLGFARVDWGRPKKETKALHLRTTLSAPEENSALTRILGMTLQILPNNLEISIPEFGCLWSLYQKASADRGLI